MHDSDALSRLAQVGTLGKFPEGTPLPAVDPERWLPKRERKSFRKGRRSKKRYDGGAQGAGDKTKLDVDKYDATKNPGKRVEESKSPSRPPKSDSRGKRRRRKKGRRR